MTKITYIPGEIANAAIDEHGNRKPVTRTQHIFDDNLEKPQSEVNQDRIEDVATLDGKIATEKQRAEVVEGGLNIRLQTVEQLAEISIGGGDAQIATGADFTNPDATKRAKVTTVGAIIDGLNDGVYDVSKRNPTGGPNSDGKFTLNYILDNADTLIPVGWRHGGMTISFVQSSDNKYVQYFLTKYEFSTTESDWQKMNLEDEVSQLGQEVDGFYSSKLYQGSIDDSNKIVVYNSAKYRVLEVNGGESFVLTSDSLIGIFVLSSFTYNPLLPYTPTFASGETGRRILASHDFTLPEDARYVLIAGVSPSGKAYQYNSVELDGKDILHSIPEQIHGLDSKVSILEGSVAELEGEVSPLGQEVSKSKGYISAVKYLGNWACSFNGKNSRASLISPILLSLNGDSLEIDITNEMQSNSDTRAVGFATGGSSSMLWIYKSFIQIRFEGETNNHSVYTSGLPVSKVKILRTASTIDVYLNDSSSPNASFAVADFQLDVFGNYSTYWWAGSINSVKVNGVDYELQEKATLTNIIVSRTDGFLTDEQAEKFNKVFVPKIIVRPSSSTKFFLDVLDEKTNKYLTHVFLLQNYTKEESYGNGQTKNVLCGNVWYDADIYNTKTEQVEHYVLQGNSNFIYRIDSSVSGFENENGHVGPYHGGAIMEWTKFIADGVEIDPVSLDEPLPCNVFRFIEKVNHYAIDTTQAGFVYNAATLKLDDSGEPILSAVQFFNSEYSVNNHIKFRNKLTIKRNNTRFYQCFGAMIEGYANYFDKVIINNSEQTFNEFVFPGVGEAVNITKLGNSHIDLSSSPYQFADTVELFGKGYYVKQTMTQLINSRYDKSNVHTKFYSDNPRLKTYQMPCICTISASLLGKTADVFNDGDFLEVFVERKIEFV